MIKVTEYNGEEIFFETANECDQYIIDNAEAWDQYNDMISECYGDVNIMGLSYDSAIALERLDPIAYRCGYNDWMDANYSDIVWELERSSPGESIHWFDYDICII